MNFKINDIVKVKENLEVGIYDGLGFPYEMLVFRGLKFIVRYTTFHPYYVLEPIPRKRYPKGVRSEIQWYYFNDAMLEDPITVILGDFLRKEVKCTK